LANEFDDDLATAVVEEEPAPENRPQHPSITILSGPQLGQVHRVRVGETILGRVVDQGVQIEDEGISRHHAKLTCDVDEAVSLVDLGSTNGCCVNGARVAEARLEDGDRIRLGATTIIKYSLQDEVEAGFQRDQFEAARRDALTGCYNKRHLVEVLESELAFARRHGRLLSLVMFDLDHFKRVNDSYGHLAGDAVLRAFADLVRRCIRTDDVFIRYGGEEFVVLMREIGPSAAAVMAERVRAVLAGTPMRADRDIVSVTVSAGVAAGPCEGTESPTALLLLADRHLYLAKNGGRNRVSVAPDSAPLPAPPTPRR